MKGDYELGGGWGNSIQLSNPEQFKYFNMDTIFNVHGWKSYPQSKPKVGDTLVGEFEKSWMKFEFIEVEYKYDPPDMFFAKVKLIEREEK